MLEKLGTTLHPYRWRLLISSIAVLLGTALLMQYPSLLGLGILTVLIMFWTLGFSYVAWFHGPSKLVEKEPFRSFKWFYVPFAYVWFSILILCSFSGIVTFLELSIYGVPQ